MTVPNRRPWLIDWLLGAKVPTSATIRAQLEAGLFTSLPVFMGGALNTIAVAAIGASRQPTAPFQAWLIFEIALAAVRSSVVIAGRRALRDGRSPPAGPTSLLSCAWAASVGYGAALGIASGDWILATIVCLSAAAMVCGICLRNFGTPRLAATMVILALLPAAIAGLLSPEPIVRIIAIQLPIFLVTIVSAASYLHGLMVSRMLALSDLEQSELFVRTILESSPDYTLILDAERKVTFCNHRNGGMEGMLGKPWLSLLPPEYRDEGVRALEAATEGHSASLMSSYTDDKGETRWFDSVVTRISDETDRLIVVSREITHQKRSEERALWMARHDVLTELPNRAVLHNQLDVALSSGAPGVTHGLLIADLDNFKTINDTLGHDAGDALLCEFAVRLRAAVGPDQLVARTGGDEFALFIPARSPEEVRAVAERIYEQLRQPVVHDGRLLHCGASIGASLLPIHGSTRSEIMKAADIALYAAKAAGRGKLRIFEESMKADLETREAMVGEARRALAGDQVVPHYQPKVCMRTSRIVGFEALLRWTDGKGCLRGPDDLNAAFDDPTLAAALSSRMLDRTLEDISRWIEAGLDIGHVAVNAASAEFRDSHFAEDFLARLAARNIAPSYLQLEVTETVFLGRGAGNVEAALCTLSRNGVKIALDDFGTGYASLAHLRQFPIDLLKIDRSFVHELGHRSDADAICAAVINLGHCLDMEIVAEGIETPAQEAQLARLGCDTAQGFYYSPAIPACEVPAALAVSYRPVGQARTA